MSDQREGEGWWIASDGKWYPPESRPAAVPASAAPPPGTRAGAPQQRFLSFGLTRWTAGLLRVDAVLVVALLLSPGFASMRTTASIWSLLTLSGLLTAVLVLVWMYQAYEAASSRGPTERKWSGGWAVGGWFLPLASFVIPKLVLNEIDRMSHPDAGPPPIEARWRSLPRLPASDVWWVLSLGSALMVWGGPVPSLGLLAAAAASGGITISKIGTRLRRP